MCDPPSLGVRPLKLSSSSYGRLAGSVRVASVGAWTSKGRRMKERQGRGREGEIEKERNEEAVPAFLNECSEGMRGEG